ncbi:hypothetical protein FQN60_017789 [Etheostoma spectabile]|uniref:Arrestin-like N-terminal domain-containing protein n=1 Tax=Etheostoma spectabile TaxID=54343 RepID=A0A5J5DG43_9PERO|nr:hypothetical protein FQN60_017789 [Etheostoma spectabile]
MHLSTHHNLLGHSPVTMVTQAASSPIGCPAVQDRPLAMATASDNHVFQRMAEEEEGEEVEEEEEEEEEEEAHPPLSVLHRQAICLRSPTVFQCVQTFSIGEIPDDLSWVERALGADVTNRTLQQRSVGWAAAEDSGIMEVHYFIEVGTYDKLSGTIGEPQRKSSPRPHRAVSHHPLCLVTQYNMSDRVKSFSVGYNPINHSDIFTSGDCITGHITLELSKDCKIGSLSVKLKGKAQVKWTETHGRTIITYRNKEKYLY